VWLLAVFAHQRRQNTITIAKTVPTIKKTSMYFLLNSTVSLYEYLSDKIEDFLDYFEGPFDVIQELEREQDVGDKLQNANP